MMRTTVLPFPKTGGFVSCLTSKFLVFLMRVMVPLLDLCLFFELGGG